MELVSFLLYSDPPPPSLGPLLKNPGANRDLA